MPRPVTPSEEPTMTASTRCAAVIVASLSLFPPAALAVIKVDSPLRLFVRDGTQIVRVRVVEFDAEKQNLVFQVEQDLKEKWEQRTLNAVWKFEPDSKWEGIRTLPRLMKCFGPDRQAVLFINDAGGFWHNKGNERKNPIAFGFMEGSWFCMESTRLENGKLLWRVAQGEPYLRTTFKGTTEELIRLLVDLLAGNGKLPEPAKSAPGFGPDY
jgi:hypothetical protein